MACSSLFIPTFYLLAVFLVRLCLLHVEAEIFNVSPFGAISSDEHSDITAALEEAWSQACQGTNDDDNTVLIPKGTFSLKAVTFSGPCNGRITFQVNGNVKAPAGASVGAEQWVLFTDVQGLTVSGTGTFDGLGETAWGVNNCKEDKNCDPLPTSLKFSSVNDVSIRGITSLNSKFFHIIISESESVEINGVKIQAPDESPNTDGIHISRSNGVKIYNSDIGTGDDCIAIIRGSKNVHIYNVNCGPGHGISIGSIGKYEDEGDVSTIVVEKSKLTSTTNGLRIKTWASSYSSKVFDITYRDITLNDVDNPILIDQYYCPNSYCNSGGESEVQISNVKYENIKGSSNDEVAVILNCSKSNPCQNIMLSGLNINIGSQEQTKATCSNFEGEFIGCLSPSRCG